jgi:hypothetical protein
MEVICFLLVRMKIKKRVNKTWWLNFGWVLDVTSVLYIHNKIPCEGRKRTFHNKNKMGGVYRLPFLLYSPYIFPTKSKKTFL